jgi:hypothetical protein
MAHSGAELALVKRKDSLPIVAQGRKQSQTGNRGTAVDVRFHVSPQRLQNSADMKITKPLDCGPIKMPGLISKNDLSQRIG